MHAKSAPIEHLRFPNETAEYRAARNALLEEERELRRQVERVALHRRELPAGGPVREDYVFEVPSASGEPVQRKMSELFGDKKTLLVYSFMYGSEREEPCPGCTHMLDALDGASRHVNERVSFIVVAKSPLPRILRFAEQRGWRFLRFASASNSYDKDYYGDSLGLTEAMRKQQEFKVGEEWDMPMLNAFRKGDDGAIRHTWGSELLYVPPEPKQQYRHNDAIDPVWGLLDVVPEGRGDFEPKLRYSSERSATGDEAAGGEAAIRSMMEALRAAVSAKNIEKVLAHYAPEVTTFDLVEPLVNRGREAVKRRLQDWFSSFSTPIDYEQRDLALSVAGSVAFGQRFTHVRGTTVAGDHVDMWFRETLGYRRDGGAWRIVHQHSSVPLDMKTMKGMLALVP